jgi:hypothetical protein
LGLAATSNRRTLSLAATPNLTIIFKINTISFAFYMNMEGGELTPWFFLEVLGVGVVCK